MGEAVVLSGLVSLAELNGLSGHVLRWSGAEERYHVCVSGDEWLFAIRPKNLRRASDEEAKNARDGDWSSGDDGATQQSSGLGAMLNEEVPSVNLARVPATASSDAPVLNEQVSLLASLVPAVDEQPTADGTVVTPMSDEILFGRAYDEDDPDVEVIEDLRSVVEGIERDCALMWRWSVPRKIKRCACALVQLGLLAWGDLLEDGNLFWELGFTEAAHWPERDRWHATVCNLLRLMAWEKSVLGRWRLYPTARLQIVRDLFFYEWQLRTKRLGEMLRPLYYPEAAEAEDGKGEEAAEASVGGGGDRGSAPAAGGSSGAGGGRKRQKKAKAKESTSKARPRPRPRAQVVAADAVARARAAAPAR